MQANEHFPRSLTLGPTKKTTAYMNFTDYYLLGTNTGATTSFRSNRFKITLPYLTIMADGGSIKKCSKFSILENCTHNLELGNY